MAGCSSFSISLWDGCNGTFPSNSITITRSRAMSSAQPMMSRQCREWTANFMSSVNRDDIQRSHVHFMLQGGRWLSVPMQEVPEVHVSAVIFRPWLIRMAVVEASYFPCHSSSAMMSIGFECSALCRIFYSFLVWWRWTMES